MREELSIDVLTNWVSMLRADVDGAVWLSDDDAEARFYERIAHGESRIVPAQSIAIPLLSSVEQRGVQGVVAVVAGVAAPSDAQNIFRPSRGDVAATLFSSSHSEQVIKDVCGSGWLSACEKEVGPVKKRILEIASGVQRIRCATNPNELLLASESVSAIIEWERFEIDWTRVGSLINAGYAEQLRAACDADRACDAAILTRQCKGVDAIHLMAGATQSYRPRGLAPHRKIDADTLMGMLRVAFEPGSIEEDEVFWKMKRWARSNPKYPLLRRWRELDPLGVFWDQRYWNRDFLVMLRGLEPGALLAVFKMDLDNFKAVNEHCGHTVGDDAIKLYCSIVLEMLGSVSEVYRRGGDEVIALAPGLTEGMARELAEKTRAEVEARFIPWALDRGLDKAPTASIGLVVTPAEKDANDLIRLVDEAQKEAKERGKNRVVVLT